MTEQEAHEQAKREIPFVIGDILNMTARREARVLELLGELKDQIVSVNFQNCQQIDGTLRERDGKTVLLIGDVAYGPNDMIPSDDPNDPLPWCQPTAATVIRYWALDYMGTSTGRWGALVRRFVEGEK